MDFGEGLHRLLDYTSKWAMAELLCGLLQHERLYAALHQGVDEQAVAGLTGLSTRQARSLLASLQVEDVVEEVDGGYRLTAFGRLLGVQRGWLDLFVRGYAGYFHNAAALWRGDVRQEWRNLREVGLASVRISEHGALPAASRLLAELNPQARTILDVGCANGWYLVRLCEQNQHLRGVGVEPSAALCADARRLVDERGLKGRVRIVNALAQDYLPDEPPDAVIFAFVLQELTEQLGLEALTDLLRLLGSRFPQAWFIAVEVDLAARERPVEMRADPFLRGYYTPYYLLHDFTGQRLLTFKEWHELFAAAGMSVQRVLPIDPAADPTGLEAAFAMRYLPG